MCRKCLPLFFVVLLALGANLSFAGPVDGVADFSVDHDWSKAAGALTAGQINFSEENGTWGDDFLITPLENGDEIDALSSHHRGGPWDHDVTLARMLSGEFFMPYSVDDDSNIFQWYVSGPEPQPNGSGRILNPAPLHDSAVDLGLDPAHNTNEDLDALELHDHPDSFPGAPTDWENDHSNVYFSTERGVTDPGDVFNWGGGLTTPYVDDAWICTQLLNAGYTSCNESDINIDALIVFDVTGDLTDFDAGSSKWDSDAIFFSLDPNNGIRNAAGNLADPYGDIIWWASASGVAGIYGDPGLDRNVDALDVHIPEPTTLVLLGLGLAGLGHTARRRSRL